MIFLALRSIFFLAFCGSVAVLSGCAYTPSVTTAYPDQMVPLKQQVMVGDDTPVLSALQDGINSSDWELYTLETARVLQLQGDYADSRKDYAQVINAVAANPIIVPTLTDTLESGGDPRYAAYRLQPYEILLLYQNQAVNDLALGDTTAASADFIAANAIEDYFSAHYADTLNSLKSKIQKTPAYYPAYQTVLSNTYVPQEVQLSTHNGLMDAMAAIAFFNTGDSVKAEQEIQRALPQLSPDNAAFLQTQWAKSTAPDANTSVVWVILEEGFVPLKQQKNYTVAKKMILDAGPDTLTYTMPLPIYATPTPPARYQAGVSLIPVLNIADLAALSLKEQYPIDYADAVFAVEFEFNQVASAVPQIISEQNADQKALDQATLMEDEEDHPTPADLRSWAMLPNDIQWATLSLTPGAHMLNLMGESNNALLQCPINMNAHKIALVLINVQTQKPICLQLM